MKTSTVPPKTSGLSVQEAQACILGKITPLDTEEVGLAQAFGRALAEEVRANRDLPPYDVSAMDGYAVRAADIENTPQTLQVIEDIKAGDTPRFSLQPGQCARIMTGAPLPSGADTVVRVEDTRPLENDKVEFPVPVKQATDIRLCGENMRQGDVVLQPGEEITPGAVGVLATVKQAKVKVVRKPRVAILSNGDELEALDEPFDPRKIPDSNSYALMAQVQAQGIEPDLLGIARDKPEELADFIQRGLRYDVLLISGGTSVGVHDHVRPTLATLGATMHFWRVEMRPGHPVAFGTSEHSLVFCLPGNPVSSMVCFEQLVLPALRRLMGHRRLFRRTISARLAHAVKSRQGRVEFIRATLSRDASGNTVATPGALQSSGDIRSMACADTLVIAPHDSANLAADAITQMQLLEAAAFQDTADIEGYSTRQ
ncbi:MAG: molybdopterin molybdotransferase MoeA [Betaproteobacteria bacterium]|nr:molybdopterin molybdotransferase MoeA [Betaproteobacteria bacterium]